jgi:DNA-directed RNA polymerase specialized sigma24 family protein
VDGPGSRPAAGLTPPHALGHPPGHRRRLAHRVAQGRRRRWRAWCATSAVAEELAQDALVTALEHWPVDGLPDKSRRLADGDRQERARSTTCGASKMLARKHEEIGHDLEAQEALIVPDFTDALDAARQDEIGDDLLRLMFTACHPVLPTEARVALTLKLLGGLTTHEIARAFLVPEPRSRSASCAPSEAARCQGAVRGAAGDELQRGWPRCWRWSTWCSTRATRPRPARTGCGRRWPTRRCGWRACWPRSRRASPRCTAWRRCWSCRPRA